MNLKFISYRYVRQSFQFLRCTFLCRYEFQLGLQYSIMRRLPDMLWSIAKQYGAERAHHQMALNALNTILRQSSFLLINHRLNLQIYLLFHLLIVYV